MDCLTQGIHGDTWRYPQRWSELPAQLADRNGATAATVTTGAPAMLSPSPMAAQVHFEGNMTQQGGAPVYDS